MQWTNAEQIISSEKGDKLTREIIYLHISSFLTSVQRESEKKSNQK